MKINFQDPAILIPIGVILLCIPAFFWAVGRLFRKSDSAEPAFDEFSVPSGGGDLFEPSSPAVPPAPFPDFAASSSTPVAPSFQSPRSTASPSPAVSKEMVERLDTMSQRLSDMQSVLQRQATAAPAGTPLSPETIDKLLKIVGNVTQQVDLLQKSLGTTPAAPSIGPAVTPVSGMPKASPPSQPVGPPPIPARAPAPSPSHAPTPSSTPAAPIAPPPAAVPAAGVSKPAITPESAGKGLGLLGGALSKFGKASPQQPAKTGPAAGTPPPTAPPPTTPPPAKP